MKQTRGARRGGWTSYAVLRSGCWLGGGLLVTYKVALERLKLPPDVATLYVGNLRVGDGFKHLDTAVIAGRLEPSALLVERMARAIFGDDP